MLSNNGEQASKHTICTIIEISYSEQSKRSVLSSDENP